MIAVVPCSYCARPRERASTSKQCERAKNLIHPKIVVADQALMTPQMEAYYNRQNIKPVATGPGTPWPNRAEAAVRLLKHQLSLMLQTTHEGYEPFNGIVMKYGNLVCQACLARNSSVTYGGVTPLELAFGRRPRDTPVILLIK